MDEAKATLELAGEPLILKRHQDGDSSKSSTKKGSIKAVQDAVESRCRKELSINSQL